MVLIISALFISILYFLLILIFILGWENIFSYEPKGIIDIDFPVSVVVPCKNEQENIMKLISILAQQSYQNFELIIINDHSTDSTRHYIKRAQKDFPNIKLIDAVGHGKKNALKEGITQANSTLIITTDADCMPSYHWIEAIASFYKRFPCDLIIGPIGLSDKDDLFSRVQALEFSSLAGTAAGASGAGMPILCNGANLAFTKKVWLKSQKDLHNEEQSGDDIFLLESVKKAGGKIRFLKSEAAFVKTKPPKNIMEFINQRRRWAGKSKSYSDWQIILTATIVLAVSLVSLAFLGMAFDKWQYSIGFLLLFVFKYSIDTYFLYKVRRFFQLDNIWAYSFILSLIYPIYIVFIAFSSILIPPTKWK
ncbi:MAG: glycosyltransferase [Paludibacter sp.]|jgi:poly-beta-1,6-N-acetyl-D-glucosamine synthase